MRALGASDLIRSASSSAIFHGRMRTSVGSAEDSFSAREPVFVNQAKTFLVFRHSHPLRTSRFWMTRRLRSERYSYGLHHNLQLCLRTFFFQSAIFRGRHGCLGPICKSIHFFGSNKPAERSSSSVCSTVSIFSLDRPSQYLFEPPWVTSLST